VLGGADCSALLVDEGFWELEFDKRFAAIKFETLLSGSTMLGVGACFY
jgi:hypothetical protein